MTTCAFAFGGADASVHVSCCHPSPLPAASRRPSLTKPPNRWRKRSRMRP
jgi:hypothetical protein